MSSSNQTYELTVKDVNVISSNFSTLSKINKDIVDKLEVIERENKELRENVEKLQLSFSKLLKDSKFANLEDLVEGVNEICVTSGSSIESIVEESKII